MRKIVSPRNSVRSGSDGDGSYADSKIALNRSIIITISTWNFRHTAGNVQCGTLQKRSREQVRRGRRSAFGDFERRARGNRARVGQQARTGFLERSRTAEIRGKRHIRREIQRRRLSPGDGDCSRGERTRSADGERVVVQNGNRSRRDGGIDRHGLALGGVPEDDRGTGVERDVRALLDPVRVRRFRVPRVRGRRSRPHVAVADRGHRGRHVDSRKRGIEPVKIGVGDAAFVGKHRRNELVTRFQVGVARRLNRGSCRIEHKKR